MILSREVEICKTNPRVDIIFKETVMYKIKKWSSRKEVTIRFPKSLSKMQ